MKLTSLCFLGWPLVMAAHLPLSAAEAPVPASAVPSSPAPAKAVTEKVNIFDLIKSGAVGYHLNTKLVPCDAPEEIFQLSPDGLHITGRGWGYLYTKEAYRDYKLVLEFKWTGPTWGTREKAARDSGLLLHCHGPVGALGNTWSASIEAQLIEGGMGDILVLSPKLPDGTVVQSSLKAEYELDRDKEKRWKKGAPLQEILSGRLNWEKRDEDWADKVGFRGKDDLDAPLGEWNTLEVIARGDTLQYFFNGKLVIEAFDVKPSGGPVGIQTECAGLQVRRFELLPLPAATR